MDVTVKLLECLKNTPSEEAAQTLIYQALGYFRQNLEALASPTVSVPEVG